MISAAEMHKTMYVAEVLSRTEDALEKLHHYYKFGRHSHVLLDELYSWFAHCGHLVFSLRLAGECDPWGGIEEDPHLASLIAELDFTPFYYLDYRRRIFYWNAYQEYLKAEPRWFRLWMRILERSEHSTASDVEDFSRWMLTHVSHEALTGGKVGKKDDVALMKLLRAGPGGASLSPPYTCLKIWPPPWSPAWPERIPEHMRLRSFNRLPVFWARCVA